MSKRTPLKIPKRVTLGEKRYEIVEVPVGKHHGSIYYDEKRIVLSRKLKSGRRTTVEDREDTYLHEITHGILEAMGSRMYRNEAFVTKFAHLLHTALTTARY